MSLRHRGLTRSATFAEGSISSQKQRRNSTLSDSISEAQNSIRSSTDELLFPRVGKRDLPTEESHWHSAPLGLALLPAIAGVFFKNGSAVVTDITLLILAAIFLNWSVRLPWDWYHSAQTVRQLDKYYDSTEYPLEEEDDNRQTAPDAREDSTAEPKKGPQVSDAARAASKELQIHELVALASCFIFPIIGTWLLHAIRSKLSRPSEGLVSNYNLTIFLLASEIRPFSHLLKMVQARTLYLQRIVASPSEEDKIDPSKIADLTKRLDELEAHVAETAAARLSSESSSQKQPAAQEEQDIIQSLSSQATAEVRKGIQPEIDALNRAVRRYEKRTAVTSFQTESRLQALETQAYDAIALAAAAQRSSQGRLQGVLSALLDWIHTIVLLPVQIFLSLISLPAQALSRCLKYCKDMLLSNPRKSSKGKSPRDNKQSSAKHLKRTTPQDSTGMKTLKPVREHT